MKPVVCSNNLLFVAVHLIAFIGVYPDIKGTTCVAAIPRGEIYSKPIHQHKQPHHRVPVRTGPWTGPLLSHGYHPYHARNEYTPQWIFRPEMQGLVAPIVWLAPTHQISPPMLMKKHFLDLHSGHIPPTSYPVVPQYFGSKNHPQWAHEQMDGSSIVLNEDEHMDEKRFNQKSYTPSTNFKTIDDLDTAMGSNQNTAQKYTEYLPWGISNYPKSIGKISQVNVASRDWIEQGSGNSNIGNGGKMGDCGTKVFCSDSANDDALEVMKYNGGDSRVHKPCGNHNKHCGRSGVSCNVCGDSSCGAKQERFDGGCRGLSVGASHATTSRRSVEGIGSASGTPTSTTSNCNSQQNCHKSSLNEEKSPISQSVDPPWFDILDKVNSPCKTLHTFSSCNPSEISCSSNDLQNYAKEYRADMEEMFTNNCKCGCGRSCACGCGTSSRPTLEQIMSQESLFNGVSKNSQICGECNRSDCKCDHAASYTKWAAYVKDVARRCTEECDHSNNPQAVSDDYSYSNDRWRKSVCDKILDTVAKSLASLKNEDLQICNKICVHTPPEAMKMAQNVQASQIRRVRDTKSIESRIQRSTDSQNPPSADLVNDIRKSIGLLKEPKFRTFLGDSVAFEILYVLSKALDDSLNEKMQAISQIENHTFPEENIEFDLISNSDTNNYLPYSNENINEDWSATKVKCDTTCSIHNPMITNLETGSNGCNINDQNIFHGSSYSQESERNILPVSITLSPSPLCHPLIGQGISEACCTSTVKVHNICSHPNVGSSVTGDLDIQDRGSVQPTQNYKEGSQRTSQLDAIGTNMVQQTNPLGSVSQNTDSISTLPVSITLHPTPTCAPKTEITQQCNCKYILESNDCNGFHGTFPSKLWDPEQKTTNKENFMSENGDKSQRTEANPLQKLYDRLYNMHSSPRENAKQTIVMSGNGRQEKNEGTLNDISSTKELSTQFTNSDGNVEVGDNFEYSSHFLPNVDHYRVFEEKDGAYERNLFVESPEIFPDWVWYSPEGINGAFSSNREASDSNDFTLGSPPRIAGHHSSGTHAQKEDSFSNTEAKAEMPRCETSEGGLKLGTSSTTNYAPYVWWSPS